MPDTKLNSTDDRRIQQIRPLIPPQILYEDYPLSAASEATVSKARSEAENVLSGDDDRILVIVGPCSIHDPEAAMDYARRLAKLKECHSENLVIIMRVYFEKPRTSVGWKGLINDPCKDNSFLINKGLKTARGLLGDINDLGLPCGVEFLDTLTPQYIVSWGAIGARTSESQVHRELASGLSVPVGFKNGTDGNVGVAVDAIRAASASHHFLSVTKQGLSAIVATTGNPSCHIILRGSNVGPNYSADQVQAIVDKLKASRTSVTSTLNHVMIDCSHGNSQKIHKNQLKVVQSVCKQLSTKETCRNVCGVMIESNINEGKQDLGDGKNLKYGVSVTDACISWEDTVTVLQELSDAVAARRRILQEE